MEVVGPVVPNAGQSFPLEMRSEKYQYYADLRTRSNVSGEFEEVIFEDETRLVTPVDDTGLPYCFAPTAKLPKARTKTIPNPELPNDGIKADLNHQFPTYEVWSSENPVLDEVSKRALVGARVQWVSFDQHHGSYNNLFVGPRLPDTRQKLFTTLIMGSAGYIPEYALDLSREDEPQIVGLTAKQRKWLWTSGEVSVMSPTDVSQGLLQMVLDSDLSHVDQLMLEEFMYNSEYRRRLFLGYKLAEQALEPLVEPVEGLYRQAKKKDLLTFVRVGPNKVTPPDNAVELARKKLSAGTNFNRVYNALMYRLAQEPRRPYRESILDWAS